jgi:hypothetical protein
MVRGERQNEYAEHNADCLREGFAGEGKVRTVVGGIAEWVIEVERDQSREQGQGEKRVR